MDNPNLPLSAFSDIPTNVRTVKGYQRLSKCLEMLSDIPTNVSTAKRHKRHQRLSKCLEMLTKNIRSFTACFLKFYVQ